MNKICFVMYLISIFSFVKGSGIGNASDKSLPDLVGISGPDIGKAPCKVRANLLDKSKRKEESKENFRLMLDRIVSVVGWDKSENNDCQSLSCQAEKSRRLMEINNLKDRMRVVEDVLFHTLVAWFNSIANKDQGVSMNTGSDIEKQLQKIASRQNFSYDDIINR